MSLLSATRGMANYWKQQAVKAEERARLPRGKKGYRDGGVLDYGRDHVFLDIETGRAFTIPQPLVDYIRDQGRLILSPEQRSEQHVGAHARGARVPDAGHGQARVEQEEGCAEGCC